MNLFIWGFSYGTTDFRLYITFIFSFLLFVVASACALYNVRISAILGCIGILGSTPFAGYLVFDELRDGKPMFLEHLSSSSVYHCHLY
ncbi:hypothetical protein [Mucilaginibacter sp. CSA2-8R]|uniref:hypothetical protein n=1 Tax=Mucilaginibacter sp. CSA2-8R TaxID=3141542 RepID=UPI00315DB70F